MYNFMSNIFQMILMPWIFISKKWGNPDAVIYQQSSLATAVFFYTATIAAKE